jgi:hypothetical protein
MVLWSVAVVNQDSSHRHTYNKSNLASVILFFRRLLTDSSIAKARAMFSYTGENPDELPFSEGDTLTIIDQSEGGWWKAEKDGVVFIVPAAYLELEG